MAVKCKGFSEYVKEFRDPNQRHRNPDLEPFAGLGTPNLDMNTEPPLQRKKRFDGFPVSKPSMEPPIQRKKRSESASPIRQVLEPELQRKKKPIPYKKTAPIATELPPTGNQRDDYVLLGDQSKFNENVKYRIRSRSGHEKDSSPDRRPERPDKVVSHHNPSSDLPKRARPHHDRPHNPVPPHNTHHKERQSRSKERGPPPRVVVDTGKPTRVTGKGDGGLKLDLAKERLPSQKVSGGDGGGHERVFVDHSHKGILRKSAATQSTPRLLVGQVDESNGSNGIPLQRRETRVTSGVPLKSTKDPSSQNMERRHRDEERPMKKLEEKRSADKERKAANQERPTVTTAQPNYAVKYRLGIAPHRSNGPIRFSEYQREFHWRDPIKSSPLMSAETVVYKSHPDLTLFRSSSMAEDSEYKAQFKAWTPPEHETQNKKNDPPPPPPPQNKHRAPDQPKKPKIRRSKSLKEMPTHHKLTNGVVLTAATDSSVTVKHPESDDGLMMQDGRPQKKYRSEYSRNFVAPWNYLYDEGAWKKIHTKEATEPELHPRPSTAPASASWYAEVLELRRFADEYRKRAQGTHFSREHLAQLYAKNAELWDTLSNGSVLSSRPLPDDQNRLHPNSSIAKRSVEKTQKKFGTKATPLLAAEDEISARSESITPTGSSYSEAEKENSYPPAHRTQPPPVQQQQQRKRPHLAQTMAPRIQGRVIPSRDFEANYSDNEDSSHDYNSDPYEGSESSGYGHELKVTKVKGRGNQVVFSKERTRNQMKTTQQKSSVSRPSQITTTIKSHGLPTRDTHVLVDTNGQQEEGYHHQGRWKTGHGPAAMEFEDKAVQIQEDDLMSVSSARSLASSCSLASEVLERARSRRDEFWK